MKKQGNYGILNFDGIESIAKLLMNLFKENFQRDQEFFQTDVFSNE